MFNSYEDFKASIVKNYEESLKNKKKIEDWDEMQTRQNLLERKVNNGQKEIAAHQENKKLSAAAEHGAKEQLILDKIALQECYDYFRRWGQVRPKRRDSDTVQ